MTQGKFQSRRNGDKYLRFASDGSPTLVGVADASLVVLEDIYLKVDGNYVAISEIDKHKSAIFQRSAKPQLAFHEPQGEIFIHAAEGSKPACLDIYDPRSHFVQCWERNGHVNQKWTFVPSSGATSTVEDGVLVLRDIGGAELPLRIVASGGKFMHPVFFSERAQLTAKQRRPQPILVMSETDWNFIKDPKVTHEGAFGRDVEVWTKATVDQRRVQGVGITEDRWALVWKFPGDLNHIPGFNAIHDVPLPVGAYPFLDDKWFRPEHRPSHPDLPIDKVTVEKLRVDRSDGGKVHVLESVVNGLQVAMIGSHFFIKDLWGETDQERKNVSNMLAALYKAGVFAFPCYGQHHAIVFYIDLKEDTLITPQALPALLQNREVFDALKAHSRASKSQMEAWRDSYTKAFS